MTASMEENLYPGQTGGSSNGAPLSDGLRGVPAPSPGRTGSTNSDRENSVEETLYPSDKAAPDAADADSSDATTAPEAYQLTPPEGLEITSEILADAAPVFKEIGLSNDQANKLMPLAGQFAERVIDRQIDAFEDVRRGWVQEVMSDPQIGGTRWKETEGLVATALNAAGAGKGSKFRELLNESGLGNHPEMIRVFRSLGQQIRAAKMGSNPPKLSREEIWYPNDRGR